LVAGDAGRGGRAVEAVFGTGLTLGT
jgi:hypothetical protein